MTCKPRLITGIYDLTLDAPVRDIRTQLENVDVRQTLGLRSVTESQGRKYIYKLEYGGLPRDEYEDLVTLYNAHLDDNSLVTFYYDKWNLNTGVLCNLSLSEAKPKGMINNYYVESYISDI